MSRLRRLLVAVAEDLGLRRRPIPPLRPVAVDLRDEPEPAPTSNADDLHAFIAYLLAEKAAATASLV